MISTIHLLSPGTGREDGFSTQPRLRTSAHTRMGLYQHLAMVQDSETWDLVLTKRALMISMLIVTPYMEITTVQWTVVGGTAFFPTYGRHTIRRLIMASL